MFLIISSIQKKNQKILGLSKIDQKQFCENFLISGPETQNNFVTMYTYTYLLGNTSKSLAKYTILSTTNSLAYFYETKRNNYQYSHCPTLQLYIVMKLFQVLGPKIKKFFQNCF